jgi:dCMP deaminase
MTNWDQRYIDLAKHISTWSKDPSTKVGAVIVGNFGQILSLGYNGFPRGIEDSHDRLIDREQKYALTVHAEMNAIYNATHNGVSLNGSTLYVYGLPICSDCARGVIQVGIKKVVMSSQTITEKWIKSWELSKKMFDEVGLEWKLL